MSSRRKILYAGAALSAGLAGAGAFWWQSGRQAMSSAALAVDPFWGLALETPDGAPFKISSLAGQPLLLNFWATWCPPCVEELPLLNRFHLAQQSRGWRVLGLAVDQPIAPGLSRRHGRPGRHRAEQKLGQCERRPAFLGGFFSIGCRLAAAHGQALGR